MKRRKKKRRRKRIINRGEKWRLEEAENEYEEVEKKGMKE